MVEAPTLTANGQNGHDNLAKGTQRDRCVAYRRLVGT
jgi:hypothetical protein